MKIINHNTEAPIQQSLSRAIAKKCVHRIRMCPLKIDLGHKNKKFQTEGQMVISFCQLMSYCSFLLFPSELTIIYRMNSFDLFCSCVPLVSSYFNYMQTDRQTR